MDIKSKNSKIFVNLIVGIILFFVALGMYLSYPKIEQFAKEKNFNPFERSEFITYLNRSNYALYFDVIKNKSKNDEEAINAILNANDVMNSNSMQSEYSEEYIKDRIEYGKNELRSWRRDIESSLRNLEYCVKNKENNESVFKGNEILQSLMNDKIDPKDQESLNNVYRFYIVIDFDDRGNATIKNTHGINVNYLYDQFEWDNEEILNYNGLELNPIKNTRFVYGVPKELLYDDQITYYMESTEGWSYLEAESFFIKIALIIIGLMAIIIPYKKSKQIIGFEKFSKLPFEIHFLILFMALMYISNSHEIIIIDTIKGSFLNFFIKLNITQSLAIWMVTLVNVMYWFILLFIIFLEILLIKYILNKGIKAYFKTQCLTVKVFKWLLKCWNNSMVRFKNLDLKDDNKKKVKKILIINFIILVIMCSMWFFGIIVAAIYTIILFRIITKNTNEIKDKYNKLFEATNKIAKGNLDIKIDEDLGIFNSFKYEVESIQKGFKNAVEEETKSQKMKTDLISNVSHDLKTPLTAIITYTDLLKDENISDEKRKEYLEILDRKSERLQELIEDLFEVSKATSGNITLNLIDVDVVSLMKQTLLELDDKIQKSGLVIKSNFPIEKVMLSLDSQRMFRVFENLIINITKYAMPNSRVYIDIKNNKEYVEIVLKNMSATEISLNVDEMVERFVRGDKSRNTEGSGLGLAIAKTFVDLHGGKFDIKVDGDLFKVIIKLKK
ncbi:sensor histidine kinase [Clostridium ihumii]|uniref:sensor histidine kinase n=1 Tax=Clostridium ihumii TaxID=1470356 RepID=UPI003D34BEB0